MNPSPTPRRALRTLSILGCSALVVAGVVAACSGAQPPARPRDSLLDTARAQGTFVSPATWRYHPKAEAPLLARVELSSGTLLYAGERGERWEVVKKTGVVHAAARLAPEPLIAILQLEDGGWLFVGQSGTGYEAREPLGPFVRTSAPVDKLSRVSAAGTGVVGITRDGQLVQSPDAGATWKAAGPERTRFVDVMLADSKKGIALAVPEAIFETKDGGSVWTKLDTPTIGALALGWDDQAGVAVQTAFAWARWDSATGTFPPLGRTPAKGRFKLAARPSRGPDANALADGRAIVLGGTYLEVALEEGTSSSPYRTGGQRWVLWRGAVGGALRASPLDAAAGCAGVRLAGGGRHLYLACSRSGSGVNQNIVIHKSEDAGKTFEREDYAVEGRLNELVLAVGQGGALAVTGICVQHATSRGCQPQGIHHRRIAKVDAGAEGGAPKRDGGAGKPDAGVPKKKGADDRQFELAPSAVPSLKGAALAMAYSLDGRTLLAVGRRTKDTGLAVFVSKDGGESFEGREIEIQGGADEPPPVEDRWARPPSVPVTNVASVGAAEDGTFSLVLRSVGSPAVVVVDDEGRVISHARAPGEANNVGAIGTRALAFSDTTRAAWESLDGGATWDPIGRLPVSMCRPESPGCVSTVRCHVGGCVIGSELSRSGWRGQADDDQGVFSPNEHALGDVFDRKVRTPMACSLDEKPWQVLEGVARPPDAKQAAMGKVAWYALAQDDRRASASVYHAHGGAKPAVESVALLPPVAKPGDYALAATTQIEGAAALRYPAPEVGHTSLKNVEVAWDNLVEGKVVRQRLADAGPVAVNDFQRTGYAAQRAQPNLLSIASGGLYLRIHYSHGESQPTSFLDGRTVATVPAVTWPGSSTYGSRTDMVHVGGVHLPVMMIGAGAALMRARRDGSAWAFDALATGLAEPSRFGLTQVRDLAYAKGAPGFTVTSWDVEGTRRENLFFPFRATGAVTDAPIPLPTQPDAGDRPSRCGSVHKSDTPRVVVQYQGGTRHPVVVTDTTEPMRVLLTGQAVMHGTPKDPCVAAFDAEVVAIDPSLGTPEQERAVIVMDDLEHSWIFRTTYGSIGEARVEYRQMSCRFDPSAEPPAEIFGQPGTRVRRAK
ncbi:MAG: hypothetical protein IT377_19470 [Polyangiaceae bacterium]|nr:hypothetical protein [Polyangiaceae bacterium]